MVVETQTSPSGKSNQAKCRDLHTAWFDGADSSGGWCRRGLESLEQAETKSEEDEGRERPTEDAAGSENAEKSRTPALMTSESHQELRPARRADNSSSFRPTAQYPKSLLVLDANVNGDIFAELEKWIWLRDQSGSAWVAPGYWCVKRAGLV